MRKWHRVSGLFAAVFIFNLAITGIILNHPNLFRFGKSDTLFPHKITHTLSHPSAPSTLWIGTEQGLYVSHDSGNTTQKVTLRYPDFPVTDIFIDPAAPKQLYVTFKNHLVVHSKNGGRTWSRIQLPETLESVYSISKDAKGLLLTSDNGIFRLHNDSLTDVLRTGRNAQFLHTIRALHSGYIFAPFLIWFHDITAIILILLIVSGLVIYIRIKRR